MKKVLCKFLLALLFFSFVHSLSAKEVNSMKDRGIIRCGVYKNKENLSIDEGGRDYKFCKMITLSIMGDENLVEVIPVEGGLRWDALKEGIVDILYASPTWTLDRDIEKDITFSTIFYIETQDLLSLEEVKTVNDVKNGASVCATRGTTLISPLVRFIAKHKEKDLKIMLTDTTIGRKHAFLRGECSLFTGERGTLANIFNDVSFFKINKLAETVDLIPIAVAVKSGNIRLSKITKWLMNGLILAEKKGVNRSNIDEIIKNTNDKEIRYMLGVDKGVGTVVGLDDEWLYRVIKKYGNYGEIYDDLFGKNSKYNHDRGMNNIYENSGFFYSYPFK